MPLKDKAKLIAISIRKVAISLADSDIEASLAFASLYGEFLRINHVGVYADIDFEEFFAHRLLYVSKNRIIQRRFGILHLMTTPLVFGGHTRVVERLLEGGLGDGLASLDIIPEHVLGKLPNRIRIHSELRQQRGVETIRKILDIALQYSDVILHIHPDDIYSAIAACILSKLGLKVYMYNHSDHSFSFGYASADKVFEISKYGWNKGAIRGIEFKQSFVGIPIPRLRTQDRLNDDRNEMQGFMAGSAGKFFPSCGYSAIVFLNDLFQQEKMSGVKMFICGPTGHEKIWRKLNDSTRNHIVFLGQVSHLEYLTHLSSKDFYVDSFPQGNGTGFVEAVMLGMPAFGLDIFAGCSAADSLRSHSVSSLIEDVNFFQSNRKMVNKRLFEVREKVIQEQSVEVCVERVHCAMRGAKIPLPPSMGGAKCKEYFWEDAWKENNRINIHPNMLSGLPISQKIRLIGCWAPYLLTLSFIKMALVNLKGYLKKRVLSKCR